jgi:tRNA-splicing ligase RtcB
MADTAHTPNYACWGSDIDQPAHDQMRAASTLPIAIAAALMPDAHVGYGLPIGGVLATRDAVIPYAVGVDIACRVMVSIFDLPPDVLQQREDHYKGIIERNTLFGVGKGFAQGTRADHQVMDEEWGISPVTASMKDKAWEQLGTSGSGNHFVEFGEFEAGPNDRGIPAGRYLAVVSHSGSRGTGAAVCNHYSAIAAGLHPNPPKEQAHLAWLPLSGPNSDAGREYWAAMELMGKYASANHHIIHSKIARSVGAPLLYQVENHHNFAWKESHAGIGEVIVHRKGATPAGMGVLGYIPGTMAAPGYLVEGKGEPRSLDSASHGAGRRMSRTKAAKEESWHRLNAYLADRGVTLMSAGLDESPIAYKNIDEVMAAQADLVRTLGKFTPRLVKMAPAGERAED